MKQFIKGVLLSVLIMGVFFATLFAGFLQESYRLNPPTQAELQQTPAIIKIIMGVHE